MSATLAMTPVPRYCPACRASITRADRVCPTCAKPLPPSGKRVSGKIALLYLLVACVIFVAAMMLALRVFFNRST